MSSTATPADPLAQLSFELERFRWEGDDRLEVSLRSASICAAGEEPFG